MALVRELERDNPRTQKVHGEVECRFFVFDAADGKRYFQIDTFGSPGRKLKGKTSQTIQFDSEVAAALVRILRSEFDIA